MSQMVAKVKLGKADAEKILAAAGYVPGAYVDSSWGYEQTNRDFYLIDKVSGQFVVLRKVPNKIVEHDAGGMRGKAVPDVDAGPVGEPFRRKVHIHDNGAVGGLSIEHGWAYLWDGKPKHFSYYG